MTGRLLEFDVDKQRLKKKKGCDFSNIVSGSVNYLHAKFYFSKNEWDNCVKAASFWIDNNEHSLLLSPDNSCIIPKEALTGDKFYVSVTGARPDGYKIKSTKIKVKQEVY